MKTSSPPHALFINRSFPPDDGATGRLLIELLTDLARAPQPWRVTAIVGPKQPQTADPELPNGISLRRAWGMRFTKRSLPRRVAALVTFLIGATLKGLFGPRPDVVVVETDPPALCLLGVLLKWRYRCRLVIYLQDLHPEIAVAVGALRPGLLVTLLSRLFLFAYRRADRIILVGEDMRRYLLSPGHLDANRLTVVPNWTDVHRIRPLPRNSEFRRSLVPDNAFVVMYSGNLGLTQRLDILLAAAKELTDSPRVRFLIVGGGAGRRRLEAEAAELQLNNVSFLPFQDSEAVGTSLAAADVHYVPLMPEVSDFLMPSKLYGVLAAGRPVLTAAPENSELATLVRSERTGVVVPPRDAVALAAAIRELEAHSEELASAGERSRRLAERRFDRSVVTADFAAELRATLGGAD